MHTDFTANRVAALRLLAVEVVLTVIIVLVLLAFATVISAYSALLGGLAFVIPNAWFVRRAFFKGSGPVTPRSVLNRFYLGEAGKLVLTAIIFAFCFLMIEPLHIGALFLTYGAMLIVNLAGLATMGNSPGEQ